MKKSIFLILIISLLITQNIFSQSKNIDPSIIEETNNKPRDNTYEQNDPANLSGQTDNIYNGNANTANNVPQFDITSITPNDTMSVSGNIWSGPDFNIKGFTLNYTMASSLFEPKNPSENLMKEYFNKSQSAYNTAKWLRAGSFVGIIIPTLLVMILSIDYDDEGNQVDRELTDEEKRAIGYLYLGGGILFVICFIPSLIAGGVSMSYARKAADEYNKRRTTSNRTSYNYINSIAMQDNASILPIGTRNTGLTIKIPLLTFNF